MRFKQWFLEDMGATTSAMHGGLYGEPQSSYSNVNMPVQSRLVTKNGCDKTGTDPADGKVKPEVTFGIPSRLDAKKALDRSKRYIDRDKSAPMRDPRPDIVY